MYQHLRIPIFLLALLLFFVAAYCCRKKNLHWGWGNGIIAIGLTLLFWWGSGDVIHTWNSISHLTLMEADTIIAHPDGSANILIDPKVLFPVKQGFFLWNSSYSDLNFYHFSTVSLGTLEFCQNGQTQELEVLLVEPTPKIYAFVMEAPKQSTDFQFLFPLDTGAYCVFVNTSFFARGRPYCLSTAFAQGALSELKAGEIQGCAFGGNQTIRKHKLRYILTMWHKHSELLCSR